MLLPQSTTESRSLFVSDLAPDGVLLTLNRASTVARLLSTAVHEVNNALQVISGTVEMLEMRTDLPADAAVALERLRRQSARAAMALVSVQHYTRSAVEGDATVDFRAATLQSIALREFAMKRHGITVETAGDATPLLVWGNRARLQQAVVNLLINAEQALAEGGGVIRVSFEAADDAVVARIADSGAGVGAELRERLFAAFVSSRPAEQGAGLGLWAARQIVEAHGGTLTLGDGPGAVFRIRLPRRPIA
jgi:two-component system NtrC family sensor kinase